MPSPSHRVRRATLDDLPALRELWTSMRLPADDLERRLTEFQVVESADGRVLGGIGVQIQQHHACLHSEAYGDFAGADELRERVMERIGSLASNHGVFRLWTRETAPFWSRHGFVPATAEQLKKLPEAWEGAGAWLTLQLKDEAALVSLEQEMVLFKQAERERTAQALRQAQLIKQASTFLAILFALFVIIALLYMVRRDPGIFTPVK
jgi:N-acetylglutamate synthase-like GNAT family acetyltransferase